MISHGIKIVCPLRRTIARKPSNQVKTAQQCLLSCELFVKISMDGFSMLKASGKPFSNNSYMSEEYFQCAKPV
uniref:Uncharacterized protein n=1 Tax=Vitis vinifera TaxID=29760 RepID=F6I208_VITVI